MNPRRVPKPFRKAKSSRSGIFNNELRLAEMTVPAAWEVLVFITWRTADWAEGERGFAGVDATE